MQHSLFSSSLDEKRALRVSTKPFRQVSNAQHLPGGVQNLSYDLGYCAVTDMHLAFVRYVDVVVLHLRGGFVVTEQFNVEILHPTCRKSTITSRRQREIMQFARAVGLHLYQYQWQDL